MDDLLLSQREKLQSFVMICFFVVCVSLIRHSEASDYISGFLQNSQKLIILHFIQETVQNAMRCFKTF